MATAYPTPMRPPSRDYYDDGPSADMPPEEGAEKGSSAQTAVIPKEFFGSKELKPGTVCEVRIDRVMDKDVAVSYVPHDESEETEEQPPEEQMPEQGPSPAAAPEGGGQPGMFD